MKQTIDCPYCYGIAKLNKKESIVSYRKTGFKIIDHNYACSKCKESFTNTQLDNINIAQVHNQYRVKFSIPFPDEITSIRKKYKLSAAKMSEVLGLGTNGYSNYENGEMPTIAYGNLISAVSDPNVFLVLVEKNRENFTPSIYKRTIDSINEQIIQTKKETAILATLNTYDKPNNFTGYRKPDPTKIANLITYFIQHSNPKFNDRLKINKLLFYADFLHFKNYARSISGLSYKINHFGPLPVYFDNIYNYLENEYFINIQFTKTENGGARETFISEADFDENAFSNDETDTIQMINEKFSNVATWDMVELSKKEKLSNRKKKEVDLIDYPEFAFQMMQEI